jgi:serine/threonine protein kinase/tetratricopeptide (TPR) repeat protein
MQPGDVVADRFAIEAIAGSGGMGTVYRANDLVAGQQVALKVLGTKGHRDAARFAREAALLAELVHPGIVRYIAHGVTPEHEPYLVMEWLEGETLHTRLQRGRLAIADAIALMRATAEALAVAHKRGVVHRDLKPMNMILPDGELARVKLLDFGIARHVTHAGMLTQSGNVIGTPGYMSPEQVRGETSLDARTDVFALGCVLYRCVTGTSAFGGDQSLAVLAKILVHEVQPPSALVPGVPLALDQLVARMLAKDAAARPTDASELIAMFDKVLDATAIDLGASDTMPAGTGSDEVRRRSTASSSNALTSSEQRLLSLVLTGGGPAGSLSSAEAERLRTTATAFGARLEHIADGASLLLFTHAGVATDHAQRAARCALALRDALPTNAFVIASGRAAVERLPVGDVIDRAVAVLEQLASGQIAVDDPSAVLLDDRYQLAAGTGELRLLRGMRDGDEPARTVMGRHTPLVGRDREIAMLEGLWAEVTDERVARVVLVTAPPGAGKSRLRHELARRILQRDDHSELLIGRGDSLRAGSPFSLVADAIRRAAGLREGDDLERQRASLLARAQRHLPGADGERVAHLLGELAGVAFPSDASDALRAARADAVVQGDAMRTAWVDWLSAETRHHPVLFVLEDLHWADRATVDYVDLALSRLAEAPLLVVALARPEVHDQFPKLWHERALQQIRLPALTKKAGEKLVRDLLGAEVEAATVARIVERSAGNAFFLEELIRAVAQGRADALPESVLAMLQQRLDELGPAPKRALRAASVFGSTFWRGGTSALLAEDAGPHLVALVEGELIAPQPESRVPGETEYAFRHDLVREAAYATMSTHDRVLGHRLAGDWLVGHGYTDALALAGHFSLGEDLPRAGEYYARAAEHAVGTDNAAAIAHAERGLACGATGELAGRLQLARAEAFNWSGRHGATTEAAAAAAALLPRGSSGWFRAQDELFFAVGRLGEIPRAMTIVRDLMTLESPPEARRDHVRSLARASITMLRFGPPDVGNMLAQRVEELASQITSDITTEQRLYALRAVAARTRGQVEDALAANVEALRCCERSHNLRELAFTYLSFGGTYDEIGDHVRAVDLLRQGLVVAERVAATTVITLLEFSLALACWHLKRLDESCVHAERAIAGCGEHDRAVAGLAGFTLANAKLALGDLDAAQRHVDTALERLATFPEYRSIACATQARIHIRRGAFADAVEVAAQARGTMKPQNGFQEGESFVRLCEIEALEAAGQVEAAREATLIAIGRIQHRSARIDEAWRAIWLAREDNAATLARRAPAISSADA